MPQPEWLNRNLFLTVLGARTPSSRCWSVWSLLRSVSSACRWLPSLWVPTWLFHCVYTFWPPPCWYKDDISILEAYPLTSLTLCVCVCVSRSVVSDSATPWTIARLSVGILQARMLEWVAISFSRLTLITSLRPCLQIQPHWGVKASTYEFGGRT